MTMGLNYQFQSVCASKGNILFLTISRRNTQLPIEEKSFPITTPNWFQ